MDEKPKDYSSVYCEERIKSDGESHKRRSESGVDLLAVVAKLQNLPQKNHTVYAIDTLNNHFSSVFANRKAHGRGFKVLIKYNEDKESYLFRVERNTMRNVIERSPKKGDFRLFFKQPDEAWEEIEAYDQELPYQERDGNKMIYCQVFNKHNNKR